MGTTTEQLSKLQASALNILNDASCDAHNAAATLQRQTANFADAIDNGHHADHGHVAQTAEKLAQASALRAERLRFCAMAYCPSALITQASKGELDFQVASAD